MSRLVEDLLAAGHRIDELETGIREFLDAHEHIVGLAVLLPLEGSLPDELQKRHHTAVRALRDLVE
jgi:hypothetical protein